VTMLLNGTGYDWPVGGINGAALVELA